MNAEKMTREEFERLCYEGNIASVWDKFDALQRAGFVPAWERMPKYMTGFAGTWVNEVVACGPDEFYIPAPHNPTDAELVAMFNKLDLDKKLEVLRDAGVVV